MFTLDELLDTIMIYAMTGAFHSSIRFYAAAQEARLRSLPEGRRIEVPTAFARFRDPLHPWPPRSQAEKGYASISRWTEIAHGGLFAALEAPACSSPTSGPGLPARLDRQSRPDLAEHRSGGTDSRRRQGLKSARNS